MKREDLFITSKLWNTFHKPELVEKALRETLKNLNVEYVNLYLIHWPLGYKVSIAMNSLYYKFIFKIQRKVKPFSQQMRKEKLNSVMLTMWTPGKL